MARQYEVLRQLYRIVERRDGAIYKTQYVKDIWVRVNELGDKPSPPIDHVFCSMPTSHDGQTIRKVIDRA